MRPPRRSRRPRHAGRPSCSSSAPISWTTAPPIPTSRRWWPKACTSSARWRPRRCARPSSSPPGGRGSGSSRASSSCSSGMPRARPERSPTCLMRSWRPGCDGRAERSPLRATRHPAASPARSRSRPTVSTSPWTPSSARSAVRCCCGSSPSHRTARPFVVASRRGHCDRMPRGRTCSPGCRTSA